MAGEDSPPFSRNWLTYNFSMEHLAGTSLSTLRDLFQSCLPQPISLGIFSAPDPNMTALIHAFQPTGASLPFFLAHFCVLFWDLFLYPGGLGTASGSHSPPLPATSQGTTPLPRAFTICCPTLKNAHSDIWELLRVEKESSFDDHSAMGYSTSL